MNIVRDTREKLPLDLGAVAAIRDVPVSIDVRKLDYGDYSIFGLEDRFAIERKRNTGELAINLGKERRRFWRELEALSKFRRAILLCEFPEWHLGVFPEHSGIPPAKRRFLRMNAGFLIRSVQDLQAEFGLEVIYCNDRKHAEDVVFDLLLEAESWDSHG